MKPRPWMFAALALLTACPPGSGVRAEDVAAPAPERDATWASGRLEVGTRMTYFVLTDPEKDSFIGSINHLEENQDYVPYKVFVDCLITPYLGLELTWDEVSAAAKTEPSGVSDGDFTLTGPILTLFLRYPNESRLVPYLGVGLAYMFGNFDEETWWGEGYESVDDWRSQGSPSGSQGKTREMDMQDSSGLVLTAGTGVRLTSHWSADLNFRYTDIDTDVKYTISDDGIPFDHRGPYNIPLSNYAFGLGVKYVF